jgi:4-alpha-glucanotransferase
VSAEIRATYRVQLHAGFGFAAALLSALGISHLYCSPYFRTAAQAIIAATLEDALAIQRRPNLPGTPERSWSMDLSERLEEILSHPLARAIARSLRRRS